jgi:hypothetical protein
MGVKRKKYNGGVQGVRKRVKKPGTVDVGIIDAGPHKSGDMTVAAIGYVHEYGAEIDHPGGTPYIIVGNGQARFVKHGTPGIVGVTQPHKIVIPERSYFRTTLQEERKRILAMQIKLLKKIAKGEITTEKALAIIGEYLADKIHKKIIDINDPPNSPATIARKGSSNPLVDTKQLSNSITYEVNR